MQENRVPSLACEDPLEKEMATYSRILACRIPGTEEPGGLQSMGFPRQESWSRLPFPSPGDPPHPGTEPESPALAGSFFTTERPGKSILVLIHITEWSPLQSSYVSASPQPHQQRVFLFICQNFFLVLANLRGEKMLSQRVFFF